MRGPAALIAHRVVARASAVGVPREQGDLGDDDRHAGDAASTSRGRRRARSPRCRRRGPAGARWPSGRRRRARSRPRRRRRPGRSGRGWAWCRRQSQIQPATRPPSAVAIEQQRRPRRVAVDEPSRWRRSRRSRRTAGPQQPRSSRPAPPSSPSHRRPRRPPVARRRDGRRLVGVVVVVLVQRDPPGVVLHAGPPRLRGADGAHVLVLIQRRSNTGRSERIGGSQ